MAKGRTLWEYLTGKKNPQIEEQFFNPFQAKIGSSVTIDAIDYRGDTFFVREIREYKRRIDGKEFLFADYVLSARPLDGLEKLLRLRVNPAVGSEAGLAHHALLLTLWDEFGYDNAFLEVVNDSSKRFLLHQDDVLVGEYWRIHDVGTPYEAAVSIVKDTGQDGQATAEEVQRTRLDNWDYWRETTDEANNPKTEFVFVEMDKESGWFQIWRGEDINPQCVSVV
ncbi:MAG: hypothetical protein L0215_12795 [Gemmataceae bacterium]|nr:hypothetical protein [Gemmataceae bacterium]